MEPQYYDLHAPVSVMCKKASSFPEGIQEAHNSLHGLVKDMKGRGVYGLSRPEGGKINYYAGVTEKYPGEAKDLGLEVIVLEEGAYTSALVKDYARNPAIISDTFDELLTNPAIDPQGYCVEQYIGGRDVRCMVRLGKTSG